MKIKLDSPGGGVGGTARVYEGLYRYLPALDVEFVDSIEQADVFHCHIALYETIPVDLPLVVSSHGMLWAEHNWGRTGDRINHLCIEAYRQADVVTTPSDFVAHAIARNMLLKPIVVRHGINSDEWVPGENGGYVLWNKARRDPANDPADMNHLAALTLKTPFVSTFGDKTPNVNLTGVLEPADMKELVRHAGVYLDTAKESGGPCFGVLEAMSCGVPVLAWDEGGNAEAVVHGDTGYLAHPGDYEDLKQGLKFCQEHRERLGANARQLVLERYQWPQVVGGYLEAYHQAIKAHEHGPAVSVVVPCYNLGSFLPACVDSVKQQTMPDWEMIIVNDASTDNSAEVADTLAATDDRIRVIHQPRNHHVSAARNTAIKNSTGKYILPLDADDRLPADALELLRTTLDQDRSIDIAAGKLVLFNEGDYGSGRLGEWPNNADYDLQIQGYNRLPYSSMYRRKVWERVGGYRERIRNGVEDADFWTRALSFGHRATIIEQPTLLYTMRQNSLGKVNTHGTDAWLPWFAWATDPDETPFAAVGKGPYAVKAFDQPQASVVIPVGPGHAQYVLGCLDSLLAQTDERWEAIIINDSGAPIEVPPYVTLINNEHNLGVAASRNKGIKAAHSNYIIFLDVDDIAQPRMVELFLLGQQNVGGWVYADWIDYEGVKQAPDWNLTQFKNKMLAPITGLYQRDHLLSVGGFDEAAPGWEDWELQLKLVSRGICGTRIAYPAIYYNMGAGTRREENFTRAQELVQYIQNRYGDVNMACSRCGGKPTLNVNKATTLPDATEQVLMEYIGTHSATFTVRSATVPGTRYRITNRKPFFVVKGDVPSFLRRPSEFQVAKQQPSKALPAASETAALTAPVIAQDRPIETLNLRPDTLVFVKRQYQTVEQLARASDTELLTIRGIGEARVAEIRQALGG